MADQWLRLRTSYGGPHGSSIRRADAPYPYPSRTRTRPTRPVSSRSISRSGWSSNDRLSLRACVAGAREAVA